MADICRPHQKSKEDEADLALLKRTTAVVDGYELNLYYSEEDHAHFSADDGTGQEFRLASLQVSSNLFPFLPFSLVCRVAREFLGSRELCLSEFLVSGRKVYLWSVATDGSGEPLRVPLHKQSRVIVYDGMEITQAPPTEVRLA